MSVDEGTKKTCIKCGASFDASELLITADGAVCELCNLDGDAPRPSLFSPLVLVAVATALAPLFIHVYETPALGSTLTVTRVGLGHVSLAEHQVPGIFDFVAVGAGALALLLCVVLLVAALKERRLRGPRLGICLPVVSLAVWHLLYGLGWIP